MLAKKTRYAIIALIRLSKDFERGPVQIKEIAKSEMIPQRFLEIILLELKKYGLLGSKSGKNGGYFLIKSPDDFTLFEVVDLFEGSLSWVPCISQKSYQPCEFCKDEQICKIRNVYSEIREKTSEVLKNTTFRDLL